MAKVAIITRTKNRNILLKRAIESVLSQSFEDWTMVIVNDGGDKNGVDELVAKYNEALKGRISVIHNENSVGMEAASNIGIKSSNSKYVIIHDDDDSLYPDFLKKCVDHLEKNTDERIAGVVTHSTRILEKIEGDKVLIENKEPFNNWLQSITIYRMAAENVFPPISFLYKREVFEGIGYYCEKLPVLGDWEFNLRFLEKYNIFVIQEELAYYHHRVSIKSGDYSNSVIGGNEKHIYYDMVLRNELLRKDMESNRMGIGFLVNIAKSFETVHAQLSPIERMANKLKANNFIKRLVKYFFFSNL